MTGPRQQHFRTFALYNRWANKHIYRAAAQLTPAQLAEDRGGFFKSVLGALNHLIVTDRMWMSRIEGNSPRGTKLDEILFTAFDELSAARAVENQRIVAHVFAQSEESLAAPLAYENSTGAPFSAPLGDIFSHLFNHQTHHRGQAHGLVGQILGQDKTPVLDLLAYQRGMAASDKP